MQSPPRLEPVTLVGRTVRLEPLAASHLDDLVVAGADPETWRWMFGDLSKRDALAAWLDTAVASLRAGTELPFATIDLATGRAVGSTRYLNVALDHRRLEIGWTWIAPAYRGTAVNTEAKLLQLRHAFDALGCRRVEFKTDALNERSRAALLGIGATFEGIFRKHMLMADGRGRDSAYYSIVDEEWPTVERHLEERLERRLAASAATGG